MKVHSKLTRNIFVLGLMALLGSGIILGFHTINTQFSAQALSAREFNPGRIIDDSVFYNKDAMSVDQIQSFLDTLIPYCNTWNPQSFVDAGGNRVSAPYVCLNNYHENPTTGETSFEKGGGAFSGGHSAAKIIYDAGQKYGINPQVLLVMLKKESLGPLTSDNWPTKWQYRYAMGYGCPDSGPDYTAACNEKQAGFYKQVNLAAWQFDYYSKNSNSYRYKIGTNDIQYSPDPACLTKRVNIENVATLSLYIYTPYVPNDAALANYPGTSNCGAYGNRNFFMFFNEWFGSTWKNTALPEIKPRYDQLKNESGPLGKITSNGYCSPARDVCWQDFEKGNIIWSPSTGAWESKGGIRERWGLLGYQTGIMGYPISAENWDGRGLWQSYQNGAIIGTTKTGFWESMGPIRDRWGETGYQNGFMGYPTGPISYSKDKKTAWQEYESGYIYWAEKDGAWESKGGIREYWGKLGYQTGVLGFPIGPENWDGKGWWQSYQNGVIIGTDKTRFWESLGPIRVRWAETGYQNGFMGYPTGPISYSKDKKTAWQEYEGGYIYWAEKDGAWESKGGIREQWSKLGFGGGVAGNPVGPEKYDPYTSTWSQKYQNGTIYFSNARGGWFDKNH